MSFFDLVVGKPLATTEERAEHMSLLTGHVENGVYRGLFSMSRMASLVGTMTNSTCRRSASSFTSFITGKRPYAPVPITSWWHFQGIFSPMDRGVCPNSARNFLEGAFLRLRISPRSITTSRSYVLPSIRRLPKENLSKCMRTSVFCCVQALFEVTAENADQRCSTGP